MEFSLQKKYSFTIQNENWHEKRTDGTYTIWIINHPYEWRRRTQLDKGSSYMLKGHVSPFCTLNYLFIYGIHWQWNCITYYSQKCNKIKKENLKKLTIKRIFFFLINSNNNVGSMWLAYALYFNRIPNFNSQDIKLTSYK